MNPQIGYCTNVHAGADLLATRSNLERYSLAVKRQVYDDAPMGVGLWLSAEAVEGLLEHQLIDLFAEWMAEVGLVPYTFNGFPFGDFHDEVVKHKVYQPDWTDAARLEYSQELIRIADRLLPPGSEGSISTLPLAWGTPRPGSEQLDQAATNLIRIADQLAALENESGRLIYLCLEPEPGCVLQRSEDVVRFFKEHLFSAGDETQLRRYLRVCHDVCHAEVMFESQDDVFERYQSTGIQVGKVQISSAVLLPLDEIAAEDRADAIARLSEFADDRYLHQTMIRDRVGQPPVFFEDLPEALRLIEDPSQLSGQWRVHFHVPIYLEQFGAVRTSQAAIIECLQAARRTGQVCHYEVETYAWKMLPAELQRTGLADGIAEELRWLNKQMAKLEA